MGVIFLILSSASCYVFGIDIGTEYTKISLADPEKGIIAAINQQSNRITPSYFAIWNFVNISQDVPYRLTFDDIVKHQWDFFDSAKTHYFKFPSHSVKGLGSLLERSHGLLRREILALQLRKLITSIEDNKFVPDETALVFAVEPTLPREERVAIAEACKIANITLFAITESPASAARTYAMEKRFFFHYNQKVVMFIDIGASHTWIAIFRFEPNGPRPIVNELSVSFNSTLGGNIIDERIADYIQNRFKEVNNLTEIPEKTRTTFLEEACRVKEILSLNKIVNVKIDDFGENGTSFNMTRKELETQIPFFADCLSHVFSDALQKAKIDVKNVDSIELIGGCTRMPLVQKTIKKLSEMTKLNRTMNADEALAIGAGYFGATMKDNFQIKPVKIATYLISKVILFHEKGSHLLFNESNKSTDKVRKAFNASIADTDYSIVVDDVILHQFHLILPENITAQEVIYITFAFNRFNAPIVYNVSLNTGRKVRLSFTKPSWMLTSQEINESKLMVEVMENEIKNRDKIHKILSDYERFMIHIKNRIETDEIFKNVALPSEMDNILIKLSDHEKWLDIMSEKMINMDELANKFKELRRITRDVEIRAELYLNRGPCFEKLNELLKLVYHDLTVSWPVKKPYLPKLKLDSIWKIYNQTKLWYDRYIVYHETGSDRHNLMVMPHDIDERKIELENWYNLTLIYKPIIKPQWTKKVKTQNSTSNTNETVQQDNKAAYNGTSNLIDESINAQKQSDDDKFQTNFENDEQNQRDEPKILYKNKFILNEDGFTKTKEEPEGVQKEL